MKVNLHCRNFDQNVKDAIVGMTAYGLTKLLPGRERLLNNVEVDINMRRHHTGGEAKIKDGNFEVLEHQTNVKVMGPTIFSDYSKIMDKTMNITKYCLIADAGLFLAAIFL